MIKLKTPKSICIIVILFFATAVSSCFNNVNVSAAANWGNSVTQKALYAGVIECALGGKFNKYIDFADFSLTSDLLQNAGGENFVALPNGLTNIGDNGMSCEELLNGYNIGSNQNTFEGLLQLSGKFTELNMKYVTQSRDQAPLITIRDPDHLYSFLDGMGYKNSNKKTWCYYYAYRPYGSNNSSQYAYTRNICWNDNINSLDIEDIGHLVGTNPDSGVIQTNEPELLVSSNKTLMIGDSEVVEYNGNKKTFDTQVTTALKSYNDLMKNTGYELRSTGNENNGLSGEYRGVDVGQSAVNYLSSGTYSDLNKLKFSEEEKLSYYLGMLKNWFFAGKSTSNYFASGLDATDVDYTKINIDINTKTRCSDCGILTSESVKKKNSPFDSNSSTIFGFKSNDIFNAAGKGEYTFDLEGTIEEINKLVDSMSDEELASTPETTSATSSVEDPCLDSQVADNLGWIICPIMNMAHDASEGLYNDFVEPALSIEPQLFSENGNINEGPAHSAWAVFQGFANIGFTILFLVVIFSQLTGVGIDNYGIKKILPKLIIAAVLVNLSYIICVICVDLSNILGNSLQDMFTSIPVDTGNTAYGVSFSEISSTVLTAVPIAAGIIAAWYLITPAILLGLLISVIGLIISLLFLFLLLAGREAAIVVLTVISPLAFLCYMLPNTKKLFDKWLKIWEGLLLVYPIAGLLMGGGNFVSRLLVAINGVPKENYDKLTDTTSGGSFFTAFAAMMISIIPVFLIPTVLKGAFSALGSIGGKLAGLGSALSGKTTGAIRKSDAYKDTQLRAKELQTNRRAGLGADGKPIDVSKMNKFQRAMRGISLTDRGVGRYRAQQLKDQDAINRANRLATSIGFEAAQIGQAKAVESDELKDYMTYINSMTNNGENRSALDSLFADYTKAGQENKTGAIAVARIAGRRKDTADDFINRHFTQETYSPIIQGALAKEIATGDNSANYRESSPLGFEYASRLNSGNPPTESFQDWKKNKNNVHDALDHFVTDSRQLVGLKSRSLEELRDMAKNGDMEEADIQRISNLAKETIKNRGTTGVWDSTKEGVINDIARLRPLKTRPKPVPTPKPTPKP